MRSSCLVQILAMLICVEFIGSCSKNGPQALPAISQQPVSATATVGQTATFIVTATSTTTMSYQWQKNAANISGATNSSYTTPATVSGDNGAKFDVMVTNLYGSITSNMATLTVNPAVTLQSITVTPTGASLVVGKTQQFTATGTYSDNSMKDITTSVIWASSNTGFATIAASTGLATGVAAGTTQITALQGTVTSPNDPLTVTAVAVALQSIAVTPSAPSINVGLTQQFTATGNYSDSSMKDITTGVTWVSSNTGFATIGANTGLATGVAAGTTQITAKLGNVVSPNDPLTVNVAAANPTDIVTYHYDNTRSGVNANETVLTTAKVNSTNFGKLGEFGVDGQIDGQILYLNQVSIPGHGLKNVIYAATEMDSVYAFDADSVNGNTSVYLWKTSVVPAGESAVDLASLPCGNISFNGVTATPVIDRTRNAIYVVAMTKDGAGNIIDRIHALDLTTGNELFGGPTVITATYPGSGGNSNGGMVTFIPKYHHERAALLESNGVIYTAWSGMYGDCGDYSAWVIAYNADTLSQAGAIDLVPDNYGGGIWMGGGGPAADAAGNIYVISGNGFGDTPGTNHSYGNSFVKLAPPSSGNLSVADYFTPYNTISEDNSDIDFGSAGPLLLPDMLDSNNVTQHLAIGGGKDCNMYVVSRDNMGQFNAMQNEIHQQIKICNNENHSSTVYFNGSVYVGPVNTALEAYTFVKTFLPTSPSSQTAQTFDRVVPGISANGTSNGIVWVVSRGSGLLYAYDATNLTTKLYDTSQAAGNRDKSAAIGGGFITPTIANGKVFYGTGSTVAVYGLLGP